MDQKGHIRRRKFFLLKRQKIGSMVFQHYLRKQKTASDINTSDYKETKRLPKVERSKVSEPCQTSRTTRPEIIDQVMETVAEGRKNASKLNEDVIESSRHPCEETRDKIIFNSDHWVNNVPSNADDCEDLEFVTPTKLGDRATADHKTSLDTFVSDRYTGRFDSHYGLSPGIQSVIERYNPEHREGEPARRVVNASSTEINKKDVFTPLAVDPVDIQVSVGV